MQIKRYEAKNMTMALKMVKQELGPDAVILSARSLQKGTGIFGSGKKQGVEVTAAIDGNHMSPDRATDHRGTSKVAQPLNAVNRYQTATHYQSEASSPKLNRRPAANRKSLSGRKRNLSDPQRPATGLITALHQQLLSQDVERPIAADLVEEIQRIPGIEGLYGPDQLRAHLMDLLEEMNIGFHPIGSDTEAPKLIAFVGPPGVGKTTTLAKLATRHATADRLKVALIGMDGYRIGAIRELQTYADILNIPLAVLNTPAALRATLKRFKKFDVVYLDTAGIGLRDQERMAELQSALAKVKNKEVHLLLRANTRSRDLAATVERFKSLPVSSIGFTHLDECSTHGVLINILSKADLPLSIMSNGQNVPEDLENGSMDSVLNWVLREFDDASLALKETRRTQPRMDPVPAETKRFLANRNSDVYHMPHCKWTRKIKLENRVGFATIADAESQRYLPCRTCKPDAESLDDSVLFSDDRVTLTHYR